MMKLELQERTDRALRALQALTARADWCKSGDLAEVVGTSSAFLVQVLRPLVRAGWVESAPGSRGGYRLALPATTLSVLDVIEAVEGPTDGSRCVLRRGTCSPDAPCALHDAWTSARGPLLAELAATPAIPERTGATP